MSNGYDPKPPADFLFSKFHQYYNIAVQNMRTGHKPFFLGAGFQIVAVVAALCAISSVRAQSSSAFGVVASGRTDRAGSGLGTGSLQDPGLISTSHTSAPADSGFFTSPSGLGTAGSSASAVASQTFTYAPPGDPFAIVASPNEPSISDNGLLPLLDVFRTGIFSDPLGRLAPGVGGGTMDIRGANNFEGTVAPHWTFFRQSRYPVTVTLPTQMTVRDDPYYFGHHYGWIAAGVNIRVPLSFIPRQYGKWSAGTSADLCYYGTTTTEFVNSIGWQMPKLGAAFSLEL
jgi:hypothetical protein